MKKQFLVLLVLSILILSACAQQGAVSDNNDQSDDQADSEVKEETYKIGVMGPYTGDAASVGLPIQSAITVAIDEVNANGGINGVMLEPIYEDSKCNPKDGNTAAQKLINVNKVKVIIGGVCSGETLGAAPIAEQNKVILISPSATSPDITQAGDFIFRVAPSDAYAGIVASNYAFEELSAKNAAVISESTDYAQGLKKSFKENFEKLGGKIVSDETYNPDDSDLRTQVAKAKAANPDVLYIVPQTPQKGILLVKQIKEAGIKKQIITAEVLIGRNVVAENGKDMEGLIGIEPKFDDKAEKAVKLFEKTSKKSGSAPEYPVYMAGGYDIVYMLKDAISKNGHDSEKIRDYLYGINGFEGAMGKITIDENGEPIMEYSILQIKNSILVPAQATPHKDCAKKGEGCGAMVGIECCSGKCVPLEGDFTDPGGECV